MKINILNEIKDDESNMKVNINIICHHNSNEDSKEGTFSTRDIGDEYGISSQKLNKFLIFKNILEDKRTKEKKLIYSLKKIYKNMGYQKNFPGTSPEGNPYKNLRWTLKGKKLITDLLEQEGLIPWDKNENDENIKNCKNQNKQLLEAYLNNFVSSSN